MTESLTTDLSRINDAFVIAYNTALSLKNKDFDLWQIGRELNVRYVLEGSVQRAGDRVRVIVKLIDAETRAHLWADRFDKSVTNLFDMQDAIVHRGWDCIRCGVDRCGGPACGNIPPPLRS